MEPELIAWLRERCPPSTRAPLGLADDAAVVALGGADGVVTTDMLMDGVDFELAGIDPRRAGYKALAANLSDLAAMAAVPVAALVSLALPHTGGLALAKALYQGLLPLAEEFDIAIAGGDTNSWDAPLAISITAIGRPTAAGIWRRDAARPGDAVLVTGDLGGSILGKHLDFTPRVREALMLAARYPVRAGMDISDGLSLDLARMAAASNCGAVIDLANVPIAPAAFERARNEGNAQTALDHALADGEDFELLLAAPPDVANKLLAEQPLAVPLTRIGEFIEKPGLWQRDEAGRQAPLPPKGYEHR